MLAVTTAPGETITHGQALAQFGAIVNQAAKLAVFGLYRERRTENTIRSQRGALKIFEGFLRGYGVAPTADLYTDPQAWQGITWGIVIAFQEWMLQQGYSMGTVNGYVSAVKVYMTLANQAGTVQDAEILRMQAVKGYTRKQAVDMDTKRTAQDIPIRKSTKKSQAVKIIDDQARALCKVRNGTPQARRDALMMCLLLDHGLRVSELASLTLENVDLEKRQLTWYRQKTGKISKHNLRGRAWQRMSEYLASDHHAQSGALLLASSKSGALVLGSDMGIEAIRLRVKQLGREVGLGNLSPHDCRHYGATKAGNDPTVSLGSLMAWGSWDSPSSAARYMDRGDVDNDGVSLGAD